MGYVEKNLSVGEEVFKSVRPTLTPLVVLGVALSIVSFGVGFLIFIPLYVSRKIGNSFSEIVITNRRVIRKTGMISRHTDEFLIRQIESVEIQQGVFGRMFGFGTV